MTPGVGGGGVPAGSGAPGVSGVDQARRARVWLCRAVEPGTLPIYRMLAAVGPAETVRLIRSSEVGPSVRAESAARWALDAVTDDLLAAERLGARLLTPEDAEWPDTSMRPMELAAAAGADGSAPPFALWLAGGARLDELTERAVAIVGTRACTPYGERVAGELAYSLASRGWTILSGGAYGIDGAAHRGALAAGGRTIAVIAGGLRRPYPAGHAALFTAIRGSGLLVSEWPVDCSAQRHRFLIRNRLIAGLAAGVVVVEALARSGATNTARHASTYGRPLMAVPGPVTSAASVGCHHLVRERDARLVTNADEIVEMVGRIGDLAPLPHADTRPRDRLDRVAQRVLDGLPATGSAGVEQIAVESGVAAGEVLRHLPALELYGFVEATTAGWRITPAGRRS